MSRSQLAKSRKEQKKRRRKKERDQRARQLTGPKLSAKLSERVDYALHLAGQGHLQEAKKELARIANRGTEYPQVIKAQLSVAQKLQDHEACCRFSERLRELQPRNAEAVLMYAQSSMYCRRATVALASYEAFLETWPEHAHVSKITKVLPALREEVEQRIEKAGFPQSDGVRLQSMHEQSLRYLQTQEFAKSEECCLELIDSAPSFCSARNNFATVRFHVGRLDDALATARETYDLFPDNQFAEIACAKFCFLSGKQEEANQLMESIVKKTLDHADVFVARCDLMAMLGRDDELVTLCESVDRDLLVDPHSQTSRLHYAAYAHHRLGHLDKAKAYRVEYVKHTHKHLDAEENLDDLESNGGHAPWASAIPHWLPNALLKKIMGKGNNVDSTSPEYVAFSRMVPILLDRGDPTGRTLALSFAKAVGSEPLMDALRDFAYGQRGPDKQRSSALTYLNANGHLETGPHRIFSDGKWREIQLLSAQIYWGPVDTNVTPEVSRLYEEGHEAMVNGQFDLAEECFDAVIEKDNTHLPALYNRCATWIQRDDEAGIAKARPEIEKLHQDYPDYVFARTAMVNYLLDDGKVAEAKEMLVPIVESERLHFTEARAMFFAQATICKHEGDWTGVQITIDMLAEVVGDDDPDVIQWRDSIAIQEQYAILKKLKANHEGQLDW